MPPGGRTDLSLRATSGDHRRPDADLIGLIACPRGQHRLNGWTSDFVVYPTRSIRRPFSGISQLIDVANRSTHVAVTPVTVANPPISRSTTAK